MTLTKLIDHLLETGLSLEISHDSQDVIFRFRVKESGTLLGCIRSIHKKYLDRRESLEYKEHLIEETIESGFHEFQLYKEKQNK